MKPNFSSGLIKLNSIQVKIIKTLMFKSPVFIAKEGRMTKSTLKVEKFEKYYGTVSEVIRQIENCPKCGAKLIMTHLSDLDNLYVHEEVKCMECNYGTHETLHVLN